MPIGISGLLASSASLGHMWQKQSPGTHHHVIPWVLRSLTSLPSSIFGGGDSYVHFIADGQGSGLHLA